MTPHSLQQFEMCLERLESAVSAERPLPEVCQLMQQTVQMLLNQSLLPGTSSPPQIESTELWLSEAGRVRQVFCASGNPSAPSCSDSAALKIEKGLHQLLTSERPLLFQDISHRSDGDDPATEDAPQITTIWLMCGRQLSDAYGLVASFQLRPDEDSQLENSGSLREQPSARRESELTLQAQDPGKDHQWQEVAGQGILSVVDCVAAGMTRQLLSAMYQLHRDQRTAAPVIRLLHQADGPEEIAGILSSEAVHILGAGRVSVLIADDSAEVPNKWRVTAVTAVTGSADISQDSDVIRGLQLTAVRIAAVRIAAARIAAERAAAARFADVRVDKHTGLIGDSQPLTASQLTDCTGTQDVVWHQASSVLETAAACGSRELTILRLRDHVPSAGVPGLLMIIELFAGCNRPPDSLIRLVIDECRMALAGSDHHRAEGFRQSRGHRFSWVAVSGLVLFLLLWLIPAELRIMATGQLLPAERRRVFAPEHGVVEELLVAPDDQVAEGQVLLRLRSAERDLELNRLLGEQEFVRARLQAIRTARSVAGGNVAGTGGRQIDLSSDEQQWQQRLKNLQEETELLRQQISQLTVTAPIDGVVYQRRLDERLAGRPVQKGQLLLELLRTEGEWTCTLQIPDADVGYVADQLAALQSAVTTKQEGAKHEGAAAARVELSFPAAPQTRIRTELRELGRSIHTHSGGPACEATVVATSVPEAVMRPGAAVVASIHCGRRSLGFVWFREVIEFCQRMKFSWM